MTDRPPDGYVMCIVASSMEGPYPEPHYLVSWDVDAMDGFGFAEIDPEIDSAHVFATFGELMDTWKSQSTVKPYRDHDGQPNRPLTAYTVDVLAVDVVGGHAVPRRSPKVLYR